MPYASAKQANLMRAVAHSPSFAKKVGIPQSVGQKFESHKAKGGEIMASKKLFGGKESYAEELKEAKAIKSGRITPQQYARGEREEERGMKKRKFAEGGMPDMAPEMTRESSSSEPRQPFGATPEGPSMAGAMQARDDMFNAARTMAANNRRKLANATIGRPTGMPAMKKGGSVKKYAKGGGIESKGKTKGKIIKMKGGGSC